MQDVDETLDARDFSLMHNWMFSRLSEHDMPNISLALVYAPRFTPEKVAVMRPLPPELFPAVKAFLTCLGHLQLAFYYFSGFEQSIRNLISCFHMKKDGKVKLGRHPHRTIGAASVLFGDAISDGRKLVDKMEHYLEEDFGEASAAYQHWRELTRFLYDQELAYALCYNLRNVHAHEDFILNLTAVDKRGKSGYLVINFDHEIMAKSLNASAKKLIREFSEERAPLGVGVKRNVGTLIQCFFGQVTALYDYYQTVSIELLTPLAAQCEPLFARKQELCTCVAVRDIKKKGFPEVGVFWPYSLDEFRSLKKDFDRRGISRLSELEAALSH